MTANHILVFSLIIAGIWDLYVLYRYGIASGKTVSWLLYTDSRTWPAIAFLIGYAAHWGTAGYEVVTIFGCVCGHIFGQMRGASSTS